MKKQRMIILAVVAGLIVVIMVALIGVLSTKKRLELVNINQVDSGLSTQRVTELEDLIWRSLKETQGFDESRVGVQALIRPSSFSKVAKNGVTDYDFLVDIDEFKSTYEISFAMTKEKKFYESPVVDCPLPELMKYTETYCKSEQTTTMMVTVGRQLPYYFNLEGGELVMVTRGVAEDGGEYLKVRVNACGDETVMANARERVRMWVKSLGIEADNYRIEIVEFCDGEA